MLIIKRLCSAVDKKLFNMPHGPANIVRNMSSNFTSPPSSSIGNYRIESGTDDFEDTLSYSSITSSPKSPDTTYSIDSRRPPPGSSSSSSHFRSRPLTGKIAVIRPNNTMRLFSKSPSPAASLSLSRCSSTTSSLFNSIRCKSPTPRRIFPQVAQPMDLDLEEELSLKEQAPVVYDASINFVLGIPKQKIRQSFKPTASHLEPETASSLLSSKIANFLQRTDHIMDEWKRLGHKNDAMDIDNMMMPHNRHKSLSRSKSATNIMIKGYQYFSRGNSVAKSIGDPLTKLSRLSEDRTLSEFEDNEVETKQKKLI